jgi:hypothetical protein
VADNISATLPNARMVDACRICKGRRLTMFLSLGSQPHCNSFLRREQLDLSEPRWPLNLLYCEDCHLVQLDCVVDSRLMFGTYVYVSGTTATLPEHFRKTAADLVAEFRPAPEALVVDIGSNDGTFLSRFKALGLRTIGVDPASNIARIANACGIETINDFFGETVAHRIRQERGPAALLTAAGVFFHIDDMDDVCRGVYELLDDQGVFHIQAIYLGSILEQTSFDNVYHEHLSYYTLGPLIRLLGRFGLSIFHVGHSPIHGGSLLVYACKEGAYPVRESVTRQLEYESTQGWDRLDPYLEFGHRVSDLRDKLLDVLGRLKGQGKRIAAYGAPAKGNTLLNYCRIGPNLLEYACEIAPLKIGLFTPGTHIPVIDEAEAMKNPPDYFLLLPWNFGTELMRKNQTYHERGGRFIVPIPSAQII